MGELIKFVPSGSPYLDEIRRQIVKKHTPKRVMKKIEEFLEAEKVIYDGEGKVVSRQKDWATQMKGLEKVLELQGVNLEASKESVKASNVPTKITIVVNGEQKSVEVKAENKESIETAIISGSNEDKENKADTAV